MIKQVCTHKFENMTVNSRKVRHVINSILEQDIALDCLDMVIEGLEPILAESGVGGTFTGEETRLIFNELYRVAQGEEFHEISFMSGNYVSPLFVALSLN